MLVISKRQGTPLPTELEAESCLVSLHYDPIPRHSVLGMVTYLAPKCNSEMKKRKCLEMHGGHGSKPLRSEIASVFTI